MQNNYQLNGKQKVTEKEGHPIIFAEPTEFVIKNFWAGEEPRRPRQPKITGIQLKYNYFDRRIECSTKNNEVFQLVQLQAPSVFLFAIDSMSGDRLLSVREPVTVTGRMLELFRAGVPICKVVRKSFALTLHHRYEVQFCDPTAPNMECNGHWPHGFTLVATPSGETLASTEQTKSTTQQEWQLQVAAGEDAVLLIGIVCAITYLRHDSMDKKKQSIQIPSVHRTWM